MKYGMATIKITIIAIILIMLGGATCIPTLSDLTGTGTIKGKVTDKSGKVIAGADIATDPPTSTVTSDKSGNYTLTGVPAGTYTVIATSENLEGSSMVTVAGGGCITPASTTTANIKLGENLIAGEGGEGEGTAAAISGKVTDDAGNAVSGAKVTTDPATTEATTGTDGAYKIENVKVIAYKVTAKKDGYQSTTVDLDMKKSMTADIKINRIIPRITSTEPAGQVQRGGDLIMNGENFSAVKDNNKVTIAGRTLTSNDILEATATRLKVKAPVDAPIGPAKIKVEVFGMVSAEFDINIIAIIVYIEDFERYAAEAVPTGWNVLNSDGYFGILNANSGYPGAPAGTKAVSSSAYPYGIAVEGYSEASFDIPNFDGSKNYYFEADIRISSNNFIDASTYANGRIYFTDYNTYGTVGFDWYRDYSGGYLRVIDGDYNQNFFQYLAHDNIWHRIKLFVKPGTRQLDAWWDGVQTVFNWTYYGSNLSATKLYILTYAHDNNQDGPTIYMDVDNMKLTYE